MDYDDAVGRYRELLDACYPEFTIGYLTFPASRILEECDPIAFREGVLDYMDSHEEEED